MVESQSTEVEDNPQSNHNHPLHLQASDIPGVALIPMKLTGPENYGVWSRSMRLALLVKNKLGFVDGTCVKNSYKGDLISAAVAPELMTSIVYASSSKKIWNDFKERFDKSNLTRISILSQGTDSVTAYYSKMRDLWDEMDVMIPSPSCDCVESSSHAEHVKQHRLLQFLIGLNESYAQVRSSILLSPSIPSVNQAYAMAIQEESQRKLGQTEGGKEPLTMMAGRSAQPHNFDNQMNNNQRNNNQMNNNSLHTKKT
ncbi:uncharacterized protein [Solanum lycopersicum]|uniref:uncharacterized protein n=1 Tax=Solanum lycopersicum TaxID=4081 RepID=UPI000532C7A9|nr:uncharacterized protein LOC104646411 [Solanum lycopersicum]